MNIKKLLKREAENLLKDKNVGMNNIESYLLTVLTEKDHFHHSFPDDEGIRHDMIDSLLEEMDYNPGIVPVAGGRRRRQPDMDPLWRDR